jgi:ABC-2 family transporter protein
MIWLTWRQSRVSAGVAAATLGLAAIALAVAHPGSAGYFSRHHLLGFFSTFLVAVPALLGAFWGAPLIAGELESGTYRLAWTQSVTRTRWLAVKLTLIGIAAVAITELLSLMLTWWSTPADNQNRFSPSMFAERGIAPMGYAAFGFALGVTAGLLIRRTLPAMATTLAGFLVVRLAVQNWLRPHFATPQKLSKALTLQNGLPLHANPGGWTISNQFVNAAGHVVNSIDCGGNARQNPFCIASYHQVLTYQPASRYWTFQSYELAVFTGLALVLIGFCSWWTLHRIT